MNAPRVLLFDLGGVIVRWTGIEALVRLSSLSREDVLAKFSTSKILKEYEIGQCGDDEFAAEMIRIFSLDMDAETFKPLWKSWVKAPYHGVKEALYSLRRYYTLACLSNTNALHWDWIPNHINLDEFFEYRFASHLIHAAKPDPESYAIPLREMGVEASDVWFFDDTDANIDAARNAGMTAFHIDRAVGVVPKLVELGLSH